MFSIEEQSERQERGQTTVSSGGICFAPSAKVEVRVKAFFHEGFSPVKRKLRFRGRSRFAHRALHLGVFLFSSEEQSKRQERGQTTVSSGGVWFAPSAKVAVRVKALFNEACYF
tara:strand:- start:16546 stop:16887 length:342 start_codon:yes stop_codon:yes gene_type:complete